MVTIPSLWLPILVSSVLVFVISAVLHMVLPLHRNDFKKVPREDALMDALRSYELAPGDYIVPLAGGPQAMKDPAFVEKMTKGPIAIFSIAPGRPPSMSKELMQWFVFNVAVAVVTAYIAGHALAPGAAYRQVYRFAGCVAFVAYGFALVQDSIWYKRGWGITWRGMLDALVYGLFTGGIFGWLWPTA